MSLSLWYSPRGGAPKSHWKANSKTSEGTAMSTWTIGKSIAAGFATVVGLLALMGGLAAYQIRGLGHQVTKITVESLPGLRLSGAVQAEVLKYRILSLKHLLGNEPTPRRRTWTDKLTLRISASWRCWPTTRSLSPRSRNREVFSKVEPLWKAYREKAKNIRALSTQNKTAQAVAMIQEAVAVYAQFEKALMETVQVSEKGGETAGAARHRFGCRLPKDHRRLRRIVPGRGSRARLWPNPRCRTHLIQPRRKSP